MSDTTQETRHPLLDKPLSELGSWTNWLERWETETQVEMLEGLLHVGFDIKIDKDGGFADRVIFYLQLADGHDSSSFVEGDNQFSLSPKWRKQLAKKAFAVLAQRLFKFASDIQAGDEGYRGLDWLKHDERLLPTVLWFLRASPFDSAYNIGEFEDGNRSHHRQLAREFALKLCKLAWGIEGRREFDRHSSGREFISRLEAAQVDLLPTLLELHEIGMLRSPYCHLTDACKARLREVALKRSGTLEEAYFDGSKAAEVLILHNIRDREGARQAEIHQLERQSREAEQRLKQLKPETPGT